MQLRLVVLLATEPRLVVSSLRLLRRNMWEVGHSRKRTRSCCRENALFGFSSTGQKLVL